jgi:hypothetical protein
MTLAEYAELAAYWRKFPPTHLLLGRLLGYKSDEHRTNDLSDLMNLFGKGGMGGDE